MVIVCVFVCDIIYLSHPHTPTHTHIHTYTHTYIYIYIYIYEHIHNKCYSSCYYVIIMTYYVLIGWLNHTTHG